MYRIGTHKERVERVRDFTNKNKLFTVIAIAIVIFIISNFLFSNVTGSEKEIENSVQTETEQTEEVVDHSQDRHWRFYWSDLIILVGAGGFCVIKIIQERKKVREKL